MTLKHTFTAITLVTFMVVLGGMPALSVSAQPSSSVTVSLPVNGSLALPVGKLLKEKLYVIDTIDGGIEVTPLTLGPYDYAKWDKSGSRITYFSAAGQSVIISILTSTTQSVETFPNHTRDELFYPEGWSADGTNILYRNAIVGIQTTTTMFYLMDVATAKLTFLPLTYQTKQLTTHIPLPTMSNGFSIVTTSQVERNPVYDNWVAIQITAQAAEPTPTSEGGIPFFFVDILWNYTTGQMISLDNLVNEPIISSDFDWSPDGRYLLLTTTDSRRNDTTHILQFQSDGTIQVVDSAPTSRQTEFWLGAGNLMLARSLDNVTNEFVYYIGEIFDGTWHETAFIRLHGDEFRAMRPGDWYIRASEQEKQKLSCTFDQSLPTQLQIGVQGRVTSEASSRLRVEPTTYSAEVSQLSADTTFSVIDGTWCANGYRWWNIQLADGTSGWIAEADAISYFIEPVTAA